MSFKISRLILLLLLTSAWSYGQTNTFSYLTWSDNTEWTASLAKVFKPGSVDPEVQFVHTHVGANHSHVDDHINYISDAGEEWIATVHYDADKGGFYFTHCKNGGGCHDDVIMNYRTYSGDKKQLTIDNSTLKGFRTQAKKIVVHTKLLGRWDDNDEAEVKPDNVLYISWKNQEHCGCSSTGDGYKHYLHNPTRSAYRVTVQTTGYTTPTRTATHDYTILPGEELYIGCSEAESQGCHSVDFAIVGQEKR